MTKSAAALRVAAIWLMASVAGAGQAEHTGPAHVWEKQELTFTAARTFANPYIDATVWVDLSGPGFKKRVYGFWDGGQTFRVRVLATVPGNWTWRSGSKPSGCRNTRSMIRPRQAMATAATGIASSQEPVVQITDSAT